ATQSAPSTGVPLTESKTESADEADQQAPLKRIHLSRQQICDDGAVSLALALRQNVRVEASDGKDSGRARNHRDRRDRQVCHLA
ncbi:unnamed protein product, partial [Ectocarpus sp. 12 AP-2014]